MRGETVGVWATSPHHSLTGGSTAAAAGLDKDFFAMGHRCRDEALLSGSVYHLPADTPVGVDGLSGADILVPAVLEERGLAFAPRQSAGHGVYHNHLTDAAGEVLAEESG